MRNYLTNSSLRGWAAPGALAMLLSLGASCGAERRHNSAGAPGTAQQVADASGPVQNANLAPAQEPNAEPAQEPNVPSAQDSNGGPPRDPNAVPGQNPNAGPTTPSSGPFAGLALVGLFDTSTPDVLAFDWPNSAIGVRFSGTSLSVNLSDDGIALYNGTPVQSSFDVTVDGGPPTPLRITANVSTYPLVQNLPAGEHTVWISKRTESQVGRSLFRGFVFGPSGSRRGTPDLLPHRLVVIGSSQCTGYGADANVTRDTMCGFDANQENSSISWPKLLANRLQAELLNMAYSGKGISRNLVDGDPLTLPRLYGRTVAGDDNSPAPKSWNAEVVVINAGGDDLVGPWDAGTLNTADFVTRYAGLLSDIRSREPHAKIYAMLGPGGGPNDRATLRNALQSAVQAARQVGDSNVFFIELPVYDGSLGYGCDFHPNHATAAMIAEQVGRRLQ